MISALVRATHGVEPLSATLAALVPAVAEGLVGDAVVVIQEPAEDFAVVADAVGASLAVAGADEDPWRRGAAVARRDWLLCLEDGDVPSAGWIRALEGFVSLAPPDRRFGRLRRPTTLARRLADAGGILWPGARIRAGDLVHRTLLIGPAGPKPRPVRIGALIERNPVFG